MTTNINDTLLLIQLKSGSIVAYETVFKKYYKLLSTQAFYILKDEMKAEDQVQQLFIEIWDKQLYRSITSSLKAYLQTAIYNKCLTVTANALHPFPVRSGLNSNL